ncbi:heparinase II/III family protein [Lagierella sp.]|uniref:heparinase II/III domain-containing protein n=1 Tax=Lagierella sp. TaxID=2849657 RepID=UPI002626DB10|nr:heparinase II/III family protein [Lagierella sp.]
MKKKIKIDFYSYILTLGLLLLSIVTVPLIVDLFFQRDYQARNLYVKKSGLRRETFSKNYLKESENLLNNKIIIPSKEDNYWTYNGDMNKFKEENRSDQRYLYSFFMLNDLINAYEQTNKTIYLDKGYEYLEDFMNQCPYDFDPIYNMPWHDEATAQRVLNIVRFYKVAKTHLEDSKLKKLRDHLEFTTDKLSTEMYTGFNNHGMFQDLSLYSYGKAFSKEEYVTLSSSRLEEYFLGSFSDEGVHLENSPEYHFEMLYILKDFFRSSQESDFSKYDELRNVYRNSVNYSKAILLPNGYVPNIGDTKKYKPDLNDFYSNKELRKALDEKRQKFLKSGYDIYKNRDSYLLLRGNSYLTYHHHDDDLSFWLYKNGDIITEAGKIGYDWDNPLTKYVRTYPAHNTVVIDKEESIDPSVQDGEMFDLGENKMSAITRRSSKADVKRDIDFDDNLNKINIQTSITAKDEKEHEYELYFHLAPGITAGYSVEGMDKVFLYRDDVEIGSFKATEEIEFKQDMYYPYSYAKGEKTLVLYINTRGIDKRVDVEIRLP